MWKEKYKQCAVCTLCIAVTHSGGIPLKIHSKYVWFGVHANQANERNSIEWITLWEKANETNFSHRWVHVDWVKAFWLSIKSHRLLDAHSILYNDFDVDAFTVYSKLYYFLKWWDFILVNISERTFTHVFQSSNFNLFSQCERHSSVQVRASRETILFN